MMERPTGPPLGAATQSTGRPMMDDNNIPRPAPLNTIRRIVPHPIAQHAVSNSSVSVSAEVPNPGGSISGSQVVALVQDAMKHALEENHTKAAEASGVGSELKPGVTIDLSHMQIQKFPEEVVDIIKNDLER
jgi:tagatose-1,6-bisphosphate aldolase non-catalytic subunit AgaZ/GatZ